jgi:propanol-preferring alcohol dehydrogenase
MQALQLTAWKHEPELREVGQPVPGPGEVPVRVGGAGACHSDLHLMHDFELGLLPWGRRSPWGTRTPAGSKPSDRA